jgi:hypothetical protein
MRLATRVLWFQVIAAISTLVACSHTPHVWITDHHVVVTDYTKLVDEAAVDCNVQAAMMAYPEGAFDISMLQLVFTDKRIICGDKGEAWGCYRCGGFHLAQVYYDSTIAGTCMDGDTLVHEIFHFFQERATGQCGAHHDNEEWWGPNGYAQQGLEFAARACCPEPIW